MAEKGLTVRLKTDNSGLKKGMDEAIAELEKYNKALIDNQYKQRDANKAISEAQKEIKNLKKAEEDRAKQLENEKKRREELNKIIDEANKELDRLDSIKSKDGQLSKEQEKLYKSLSNTMQKAFQELDKLTMTEEKKAKLDEDGKKKIEELNGTIESQKLQLSQLRVEQVNIKSAITEASKAAVEEGQAIDSTTETVKESNEHWTTWKATLANLTSDVLKKLASQIVSIGKDIINTGEQFSASMSEVGAISGATAEELAELEAAARLYGATTKFSATEAANALKYMALAGWDSQQAIAGLPAVLDLAAASGMDLGRASDIVTDYITAFGLEVEDASRFVDIMSYAMSHSNTTTEMLGEAYKNCAATAKSMGFSVEETTSALMTMANAGVKGGEAGTTLNTLMTRLATNTKGCADELKKYGVEIYDSQGNMHSLSEIMNGLISAFSGLTQEQQANLSKMIAGTNQYAGFQTLMQGMSEKVKAAGMSFEDYTAALKECDGASSDMAKTMSDNLSGDLKALQSAFDELKLKIFDDAETPLRNLVKLTQNSVIPAIDGIIKNLNWVIPTIIGAATAMGTLKASLAISTFITNLKKAFDGLTLSQIASTVAAKGFKVALQELKTEPVIALLSVFATLVSVLSTVAAMNQNTTDSYETSTEKVNDYTKSLRELQSETDKRLDDIQNEGNVLKDLQNEYDSLRNQTSLTADEESRLDTVAEQLAKTLGTSTQALKDKNGAYIDITGSIDEYIKKLEEQTIIENATDGLKESYSAYNKAKKACEEYSQKIDDVKEKIQKLQGENPDFIDEDAFLKSNNRTIEMTEKYKKYVAELRPLQNELDDLTDTWNRYFSQTVTATEGIIKYRREMGYAVDEEKEFEERCDSINIFLQKIAENTGIVGNKTTSTSSSVSDFSKNTADLAVELSNISKSSDSAAEKLTFLNRKFEDNKQQLTDTRNNIKKLNDKLKDTTKFRNENFSVGSKGYMEYSAAIDAVNQKIDTEKDKLANLLTQQSLIRTSIRLTKDELQKSVKDSVADLEKVEKAIENIITAIDTTQKNAKLLAQAESEVNENGKFTLNTLNSIQKTYPQLIDLTNDYINGVATEKQVIEALRNAYENDKTAFTNAVAAKKLLSQNYNDDFVNNTVNLFNEIRDKYDIDVTNFKNAADAKQAINAKLYDDMVRKQQEYDDFINSSQYFFDYYQGQPVLMVKRNGKFEDATQQELQAYLHEMEQKSEDSYQAWKNYTDLQNISAFDDVYNAYLSGRKSADSLYSFINTEINSGSSSGGSKNNDTVTLSGDGVTASGDTYTKAYMTWIDRMKALGKMSDESEIYHLEQLKKRTDNTAEEIYQIDLKLYNARKKLAEENAKALADIEKKNQDEYQKQLDLAKAAYDAYVNGKIDVQRKIADEAKKSADAEIAALDAVMKKRNEEKEDQKRQAEIKKIEDRLRYNKNQLTDMEITDLYRRRQDLLNEQYEADFQRSIEQQKADIQANANSISLNAENAISNMQNNLSAFVNHLAALTGTQTAAQKIVNNNQQQNIQIVQNALSNDQLVQKLLRELQRSLYTG